LKKYLHPTSHSSLNLESKYKDYALIAVASECFKEQRHQADYPLQAKLDGLIGMGTNELGQEFLIDSTDGE
jgi:hypothetical protein